MQSNSNINKNLISSFLLIFLIVRLIGDILFFISSNLDHSNIFLWKIFSSLPLIVGIILYSYKINSELTESTFLVFFKRVSRLIIVSIIGSLIVERIRPSVISVYLLEKNIYQLLLNDIISFLLIFFGIILIFIFYKFSLFNINKHTKQFNITILIIFAILYLFELIEIFSNYDISNRIINFLFIIIGIIVLFTINIKPTIAHLNRNEIFKILLYSISCLIFSIVIYNSINLNHRHYSSSLEYFLSSSSQLLSFPIFLICTMYLKIIFTSLITLPTSGIVEQKTNEFNSIIYLNSKIANTIDFEALLKIINELALKSTNAKFSWIELIKDNKIDKIYPLNISPKNINYFHQDDDFNSYLINLKETELIRSINSKSIRNSKISNILLNINNAKSMIFVPLFFKSQKIGNLILLSDQEYGFNSGSIKILNAFKDNISISIENAKLVEASIEKEKYKQELLLAKEIQDKLLPNSLPKIEEYSLAAFSKSAEIVGGDYYDFFTLKNGNYCFVIGDVSGKGISATFYMAQLKGVILAVAKESNSASELLKKANNILYGTMDKRVYITLSSIEILDNKGNINICRAGHMPIIIKNKNDVFTLTPKGLAIGLANSAFFDKSLENVNYKMEENDTCILYTDGANELRNAKDEEFGINNLKQCIHNSVFNTSDEILEIIINKLAEFNKNQNQLDDITLFSIKYK